MKYFKYALFPLIVFAPSIVKSQEVDFDPQKTVGSVGTFGGIGLLEMRNARFAEDGELSVGVGQIDGGQNYYATWQATPWLETTLRFSDYNTLNDGIDKGLDVKLRLLEEGNYRPAIAIGLQDMLGDGLFSGEYITASKRVSNFDFTIGFGFGNLASRSKIKNIFRIFGDNFRTRSFENPDSEKLRFDNYFSGEQMGFFWGVEYKTPIKGLTAKVEYSTVDKSLIQAFPSYRSKTAFNFGINYKVKNWLELGAGLQHGNQFALHITVKQNLHRPKRLGFAKGPAPDEIRARELKNNAINATDYKRSGDQDFIFERLRSMGYIVTSLNLSDEHIEVNVKSDVGTIASDMVVLGALLENYSGATVIFDGERVETVVLGGDDKAKRAVDEYRSSAFFAKERSGDLIDDDQRLLLANSIFDRMNDKKLNPRQIVIEENEVTLEKEVGPFDDIPKNIGRTTRILTSELPDSVERFTIISKERGIPASQISVLRKDFEKVADFNSSPVEILSNTAIEEPSRNTMGKNSFTKFPKFEYGIIPDAETHFGSEKNDHFKGDLNVILFGKLNVTDDVQILLEGKQRIVGNLDQVIGASNPNIPAVRSDIARYSAEGKTGIRRFTLEYVKSPVKNIYTKVTAGYLETMYSGIGGEVLYRPHDSRIGVGVDVNFVKQRAYNQLFSLRNYKTVTGHATLYYVNKKYDIASKVSVGRYLAKDWGTTIDISRTFKNGIRIGARATFTDMSQRDFGGGSFDKGIYMTIPFDFFWFKQSREKATFNFRRLGKNGGQKLNYKTNLFDMISASQPYKIRQNWDSVLE